MKTLLTISLSVICLTINTRARVSEPDSVFYGKIVSRVGDHEYAFTHGHLQWTIKSPINEREYLFSADLQPLADGLYSYRLDIPHALLAFDFDIPTSALPLTAGGLEFAHLAITVDGFPAQILPNAETTFVAGQTTRGQTHQVDLLVMPEPENSDSQLDSDRDGVPDWLENREGLDRWDPADGSDFLANLTSAASRDFSSEADLTTFEDWREFHFRGERGNLDVFAAADHDRDGIPNLMEYAFVLDPNTPDMGASRLHLPHPGREDGRFTLTFRHRPQAVDLSYQVQVTGDLRSWSSANDDVDTIAAPSHYIGDDWKRISERQAMAEHTTHLMRVALVREEAN